MEEKDSDYFFGRKRETVDILSALAGAPDRLPVLIGNSGVGKSSLARAGVLAALKRQAWPEEAPAPGPWPAAFRDSRQWCFLSLRPGVEPLKALVETFFDTWQFAATDPERVKRQAGWIELLHDGKATLADLIEATERRRAELDQTKPTGFFLYVDQGEELYVRAGGSAEGRRFSQLLAQALADSRLRAMMSMRSDFLGQLQGDELLFKARQQIDVPPLRELELREIVSRPAQLLSARFEPDGLVDIITRQTAEDSAKDVGALPLLSYTLDDMWKQMFRQGDGKLRLPAQSFALGGVLSERADRFLAEHPHAEGSLRCVPTLRLANVRDDGEPTRRRAVRGEFSDEEWRLVSELADYPNRLLITVTTAGGETYAEVAHEAIFRRWDRLGDWIAAEREFLAWRRGLEAARRAWQAAPAEKKLDALLTNLALERAQSWLAKRAHDLSIADREFIELSRKRKSLDRARTITLLGAACLLASIVEAFQSIMIFDSPRIGLTRGGISVLLAAGTYFNSRTAALLALGLALAIDYDFVRSQIGLAVRLDWHYFIGTGLVHGLFTLGALCSVAGTFATGRLSEQLTRSSNKDSAQPVLGYLSTFGWALAACTIGFFGGVFAIPPAFDIRQPPDASDWLALFDRPDVALIVLVGFPICTTVLMDAAWYARANPMQYLALRRTQTRHVLVGLAGIVVMIAASHLLLDFTGAAGKTLFASSDYGALAAGGWLPAALAADVIVAPMGEEVLLRGFLFRGWARSRRSTWITILATSLLWSAVYTDDWLTPLQIFALGMFLGWMRWRSGSIVLTFFLNSLFTLEAAIETMFQAHLLP
jgi:membrane protease YdiL (CAAX protease family)